MGAGRPPIKGSGTIRPRPPVLPLSRSPGIGGSLIGSAIKAKDEQRNAADGAFRNNDINKRKKAPPKSPRGPIKGSVKEPIRGPGRGFEPLPEPEPRMRDQVEWEVPNTIANRKPNFRDILPRIPEQRDKGRGPIQRPGKDMTGIMPIPDKFKDPDGNPYKQPGREPKDLQRQAVEDRMRKSKAQSKGGRKVNNAGGRW